MSSDEFNYFVDSTTSLVVSMFFTIRLMNNGIYGFTMRDKAIKAFETFVIEEVDETIYN